MVTSLFSEKDFIHEPGRGSSVLPPWLWFILTTLLACLIWGGVGWWQQHFASQQIDHKPFLAVTNREFSLFLGQFPSYRRAHAKNKTGYLPGFKYVEKDGMDPEAADALVLAPPDVLFLYHTWKRLLAADFIARPISSVEFSAFLNDAPEWQPASWKQAPEAYSGLVQALLTRPAQDLAMLPEATLPTEVRQAFQGWENYVKEGPLINALHPTFQQVVKFLEQHPNYARNFWRHIQTVAGQKVAGNGYLEALSSGKFKEDEPVPVDQLPAFLKVALFNAAQAAQGL